MLSRAAAVSPPSDERELLVPAVAAPTVIGMLRRPKCPDCPVAPNGVLLVIGLPDLATFEAADRGEVVLGGWMMESGPQPDWACPQCRSPLG
jgi:hypothetical protein